MSGLAGRGILAVDTSGARAIVAVDGPAGPVVRRSDADRPHGGVLLALVDEALAAGGLTAATVRAVGVVTGPGSFTGLRVGLSFAKALAWSGALPIVGVDAPAVARRAVASVVGTGALEAAVVRTAGARDHYCSLPDAAASIVPPGSDPAVAAAGRPIIALGGALPEAGASLGLAGHPPAELGRIAEDGGGTALLALVRERLAAGALDDAATLEPVYVAPPRGVATPVGAWEPTL